MISFYSQSNASLATNYYLCGAISLGKSGYLSVSLEIKNNLVFLGHRKVLHHHHHHKTFAMYITHKCLGLIVFTKLLMSK